MDSQHNSGDHYNAPDHVTDAPPPLASPNLQYGHRPANQRAPAHTVNLRTHREGGGRPERVRMGRCTLSQGAFPPGTSGESSVHQLQLGTGLSPTRRLLLPQI